MFLLKMLHQLMNFPKENPSTHKMSQCLLDTVSSHVKHQARDLVLRSVDEIHLAGLQEYRNQGESISWVGPKNLALQSSGQVLSQNQQHCHQELIRNSESQLSLQVLNRTQIFKRRPAIQYSFSNTRSISWAWLHIGLASLGNL